MRLILGDGRLPDGVRGQVSAEGILFSEEAVPGTVVYHHYRAPRGSGYRGPRGNGRLKVLVALVMTERHLLVQQRTVQILNVAWEQARTGGLRTGLDGDRLLITYDVGALRADRSGQVEMRLQAAQAPAALAIAETKLA